MQLNNNCFIIKFIKEGNYQKRKYIREKIFYGAVLVPLSGGNCFCLRAKE